MSSSISSASLSDEKGLSTPDEAMLVGVAAVLLLCCPAAVSTAYLHTACCCSRGDTMFAGYDLQAVVLACEDGRRLYPLTQDCPATLLPVLNKPLLHYQLELLEKAGYTEALVVCSRITEAGVFKYTETYAGELTLELVVVNGSLDTAEVLRQVSGKIRSDFLLLPGDLVCEEVLRDLAELHVSKSSDVTMVVKEEAPIKDAKGRKTGRPKRDEEDIDYVGLTRSGRLVVKLPKLFVEEALRIQKALLRRHETVTLSTTMQDVNVYVLAHWVLGFLDEHRAIASVQNELVPALVRRQFRNCITGGEPLAKRATSVLTASLREEALISRISSGKPSADGERAHPGEGAPGANEVRCFALTLRHGDAYCSQAKTLAAYCTMNRELLTTRELTEKCPWSMPSGFRPKDSTLVGEGCHIGPKGTLKLSVIGRQCKIGEKAKINNCIVMDGVTIEDNCTIQNSVICRRATVETGCNLNECYIGPEYKVPSGTKEKQETYVV
ncbi:unnamed protein product [Pylaiella littoralis]